jgi:hypothetical protein
MSGVVLGRGIRFVIDWSNYQPPKYIPELHDPCEDCGYRIRWWGSQCSCRAAAQETGQ